MWSAFVFGLARSPKQTVYFRKIVSRYNTRRQPISRKQRLAARVIIVTFDFRKYPGMKYASTTKIKRFVCGAPNERLPQQFNLVDDFLN
jgi:hypothetical protein